MGANVSTSIQDTLTQLETSLKANCTPRSDIIQQVENVDISLGGNARCSTISVGNRGAAYATCNLDSAIDNLAEQASKLTTSQKAGLGLNVSTDIQNNKSIIRNEINNKCGSTASVDQSIKGIRFTIRDNAQCDSVKFMNEADATSTCVMGLVNTNASKILQEAENTQAGWDPLSFLTGPVFLILGIIALVILAVVFIFFILPKLGGSGGSSSMGSVAMPRMSVPQYYR
jgi:hypothetical protein